MKFLANENFPKPSIDILRSEHFDVISVSENYSGISDTEVIEIAESQNLVILTFDKDYGEIIFKNLTKNPPSLVFFRFKGNEPNSAGNILINLLQNNKLELENKFTVIEKDNVRQRAY